MRAMSWVLAVSCCSTLASSALAQETPPAAGPDPRAGADGGSSPVATAPPATTAEPASRFLLGLRVGPAVPAGNFAGYSSTSPKPGESRAIRDEFKSAFPLTIEGAVRLTPSIAVGAYVSYGLLNLVPDAAIGLCSDPGAECTEGRLTRLGVQLQYRFEQVPHVTPWAGAGIGYEWASFKLSDPTGSGTFTYKGPEWFNLQVGADYHVTRRFTLGLAATMTFARYSTVEIESGGVKASLSPERPQVHEWLHLAARVGFEL